MKNIVILGAGGWGTALSILLNRNGHKVTLWEYREDVATQLSITHENQDFLPGVEIPTQVEITSDIKNAVTKRDIIIIALPSHIIRSVTRQIDQFDLGNAIFVSGSKGIENNTLCRISEILKESISNVSDERIVALSGPSHAEEVGRGIPTVVVAASQSENIVKEIQTIFMCPVFRVYTSQDIVGVELGGSLKNVIAIAAGICDGVRFGDNTKAALITRGIVEMTRLGVLMGANPLTFAGLSGMGDLIVTCTSEHSRNRYVGEQIGSGKKLEEILEQMVMVAEGVKTTNSVYTLAQKFKVSMPISNEVYHVLYKQKDPKQAVFDLMTRDPKSEEWG